MSVLILSLCTVAAVAQTPAASTTAKPAPAVSVEEALASLRADMQADKADVLAKNLTLSSEEAAKFWPMFEAYQKEQNAVLDDQLKGIQKYVDSYNTLDDNAALGLINAHFDRDTKMNNLRKKWLGEFKKVVGTKTAVRAMQIDRRLSLAQQFAIASQIPLAR